MVSPIALVDSPDTQSDKVDQLIEQMKQEIESGDEKASHSVDMGEFYNLFLKKGGNK